MTYPTYLASALVAALVLSSTAVAGDAPWTATSPQQRVSVVELYTSEGCSSCPPADAWLAKLRDDKRLWSEIVPLAFHTTHWDRLGWADALAAKSYTDRHFRYGEAWQSTQVYTPSVVVNGSAFRTWRARGAPGLTAEDAGVLTATLTERRLTITFTSSERLPRLLTVHAAVLGDGIVRTITAGENSGATLNHAFVVLHWQQEPLKGRDGAWSAVLDLPATVDPHGATRLALAVWLSRPGDPTPLQATGAWLTPAQATPLSPNAADER